VRVTAITRREERESGCAAAGQKIQAPAMKAVTAMIQSRASILLMKSISASLASVLLI